MHPLSSILGRVRAIGWRLSHHDFLVVLNWHQVSSRFDTNRDHAFTWTPAALFEANLEYLSLHFTMVALPDALERLSNGALRGPCVALTFDDGDASLATHIVPILQHRGLPATFFVNTAYVGGDRTYWFPVLSFLLANDEVRQSAGVSEDVMARAQELRTTDDPVMYQETRELIEEWCGLIPDLRSRLVSDEWLSSLDRAQFTIGAHGHEHERFSMMPAEWHCGI